MPKDTIQIETLTGDTDGVNQDFTSDSPHKGQQVVVYLNGILTIPSNPVLGFDPVPDTNQIKTDYTPEDGDGLISLHVKAGS